MKWTLGILYLVISATPAMAQVTINPGGGYGYQQQQEYYGARHWDNDHYNRDGHYGYDHYRDDRYRDHGVERYHRNCWMAGGVRVCQ